MNRFAYSIFSDDVRHEVGNKRSIIGIYSGKMFVPAFPLVLPKLCISISIVTPVSRPFTNLKVRLLSNEDVVSEATLDETHFGAMQGNSGESEETSKTQVIFANLEMHLSPFHVEKPISLRVRVVTEDEELKGGALDIERASNQPQ